MRPIISNKSPYKIKDILENALFVLFYKQDNTVQLRVATEESPGGKHIAGFILTADEYGLTSSYPFIMPQSDVNKEIMTTDINEGVCTWLELSKLEKFLKK